MTREALQMYVDKLAPGGVLAFHISNRHLDLEPVLGNLARDAKLVSLVRLDTGISDQEADLGKSGSHWAVVARRSEDVGAIARDKRWKTAKTRPDIPTWTDDYSSLLDALEWD
jgi:hypothetical protein